MYKNAMLQLGWYLAAMFLIIIDDDDKWNILSIPRVRPGRHSVITGAVSQAHSWQNVPPYVTEPASYTGQVLSNDAST